MLKRNKIYLALLHMARLPGSILKIGLAVVTMQLSIFYIVVHQTAQSAPLYAYVYYAPATEYIAMSLTLLIGGSLFMDYLIKKQI